MSITTELAAHSTEVTVEELLASNDVDRFEIVDGQLKELHVSNLSTEVNAFLFSLLRAYCEQHKLGKAFGAEGYYQCFGHAGRNARRPVVSFVSAARLPADWLSQSYFTIPPDFAAEIISPNDLAYEVDQKIREYLQAGVRLVWEINPEARLVIVHRLDGTLQKLQENDTLSGEYVIGGFSCRLADILP